MNIQLIKRLSLMTCLNVALTACGSSGGGGSADGSDQASKVPSIISPFDVNRHKLNQVICDPFGGPATETLQTGVKAELFYRGENQERWYDVQSYMDLGIPSEKALFFSEINVPTRLFDLGFPTESGDLVKTDSGDVLYEYFGLEFTGRLRLDEDDDEGLYEIAILSDDGTLLTMEDDSSDSMVTMVENDGDHPTKFGCGGTVYMTKDSLREFSLKYYQGPRYHISVIPMWRKVTELTAADPLCGKSENNLFFDYENNSTPQRAYQDLLSRGWKPWNTGNYILPKGEDYNPCYEGQTPVIMDFTLSVDPDGLVAATWETNIPATSQLLIKDMSTGEETMTDSDNVLRTNHLIFLQGLKRGEVYEVRAVSISETYGKSISHVLTLTHP